MLAPTNPCIVTKVVSIEKVIPNVQFPIDLKLFFNLFSFTVSDKCPTMVNTVTAKNKGISFIGTRESEEDSLYTVKEINGIKIGMADYTYETGGSEPNRKYLNGFT